MVTLALDTSHPTGSVSLARDGALLGTETFAAPSSHLVALGQCTNRVLGAAGLTPRQLDRVAVVTGPGSFTGLRIGLSFAKGLHASTGAEMVAMGALRLLALPQLEKANRVCAMIDARRGEVYAAIYDRDRELVAPGAVAPDEWLAKLELAPEVFVGTGALAYSEMIRDVFPDAAIAGSDAAFPSTAHLATIAHRLPALDEPAVRSLEPLYIRPSGAEQKRLRAHAHPAEDANG
jgi:tRNA threonylcarbamoyladenosine biosynthesis protein TsaB